MNSHLFPPPGRLRRIGAAVLTAAAIAPSAAAQEGADVPPLALYAISDSLGRETPAYHASTEEGVLSFSNDRTGIEARFGDGPELRAGSHRVRLCAESIGYGADLEPLAPARPTAEGNRVEYVRDGTTEWWVNGPLGLQHGFTVERPPAAGERSAPLMLTLAWESEHAPAIDDDGRGLLLVASDGAPALRYGGLVAFDATGRELDARIVPAGGSRAVAIAVDDSGARYPVVIDPLVEKAKLTPPAGTTNFGNGVAISGDTLAVAREGLFENPGAAFVFERGSNGWAEATLVATLTESEETFAAFADSIAIDGDTIVVGSHNPGGAGRVLVYEKPESGWADATETAVLTASDGVGADQLGDSVAIQGGTIVAGAPLGGGQVAHVVAPGVAYVFEKPSSGWANATETAKLTASDGQNSDIFGLAVAISGETVVVSAPGVDVSTWLTDKGALYVFERPTGGWSDVHEIAKLTSSDGSSNSQLGLEIALDGDVIVAGTNTEKKVYVFEKPGGGWTSATEDAQLTASNDSDQYFGRAVAIDGTAIYVASPTPSIVYAYEEPTTGWANATETGAVTVGDQSQLLFGSLAAEEGLLFAGVPGRETTGVVLAFCAVPNDECASALELAQGENGPFSNVFASASPDAASFCGSAGRDVWFRYTPQSSGMLRAETCSSALDFDSVLSIWSGACGDLSEIACDDDGCSSGSGSSAVAPVVAGDTYYLRVDGAADSATGSFELTVYLDNNTGATETTTPSCGTPTLSMSGAANVGGYVTFEMSGFTGSCQMIWIGAQALSIPICNGCTFGTDVLISGGNPLARTIPADVSLIGAAVYVQGADMMGATGGCDLGALDISLTQTTKVTIGD